MSVLTVFYVYHHGQCGEWKLHTDIHKYNFSLFGWPPLFNIKISDSGEGEMTASYPNYIPN